MAVKKKRRKRGPAPDRVKIKGDWSEAVKKALEKKPPNEGWPQKTDGKRK